MDPHFLTIATTKTRDMWYNNSGGMLYLRDVTDADGNTEPPTYHGELRYVGLGSSYTQSIFILPLVVAIDKGEEEGLQWVEVALGAAQEEPDDGLPYFA